MVDTVKRLLLVSSGIGIEQLNDMVFSMGGVMIPAHIDRPSYSVISNLGGIPAEIQTEFIEIHDEEQAARLVPTYPELKKYRWIRTSDAHSLDQILEKEVLLELRDKSIESLFEFLSHKA